MDEEKLSDAVINALSLLQRVHRLDGAVAILHGELIHADISVRAFSSNRFVSAVQKMFDDFARSGRRAQRVILHFGGQNVLFVSGGPMILGFIFQDISDLEAIEIGVDKFVGQFGDAMRMGEDSPEVAAVDEELKEAPEPEAVVAPVVKPETPSNPGGGLRKIEIGESPVEVEEEPESEPNVSEITDQKGNPLLKIAPSALVESATSEEILELIPDRRIRRMIAAELADS